MRLPERIESRPDVMMGKPCVKGTRIPVYLLLEMIAGGESHDRILAAYPQLTEDDLRACLSASEGLVADSAEPTPRR
ncbi:MAG: hypothetical protein C0504_11515 [Candidatus Solibacter sp.]|nr:hypothetical protein [Candidatus Solibacter sp.]